MSECSETFHAQLANTEELVSVKKKKIVSRLSSLTTTQHNSRAILQRAMADQHSIPRYGLRKRVAKHPNLQETSKGTHPCLSSQNTASTAVEPANTDPGTAISANSTSSNVDDTTHVQKQPIQERSKITKFSPHQLTINGRTFVGPTPPDRTTDDSGMATHLHGENREYRLFVCKDCPIKPQETDEYRLHDLCEQDEYPCIWSFPPKAREAFANRLHWLALGKTLEETRLPSGRLPNLLDEAGKPIVRGLTGLKEGEDPNDVYDEMIRRRYTALIYGYECRENDNKAGDDYSFENYCDESIELRLAMLENMSWRFDW
jgi:hypothetical protein